ncbi:MAG: hypothetical protein KBS57_05080 [Alistipes sp.]|nr:hypothetical protein [Candidatus Minthomonas equi]
MKNFLSIFSVAMLILATLSTTSCSKDDNKTKSSLSSLTGTSWTANNGLTLTFGSSAFTLSISQVVEDVTVAISVTGPYNYDNPDFEGTVNGVSIEPDFPGAQYLKDQFPIGASLPGTVSADGNSLTTHGDQPNTFKKR